MHLRGIWRLVIVYIKSEKAAAGSDAKYRVRICQSVNCKNENMWTLHLYHLINQSFLELSQLLSRVDKIYSS